MSLYNTLFEDVITPIYDVVRKTSRRKYNGVLEKTQWLSQDEVKRIQERNLRSLIVHAYDSVPYYRRLFKERSLYPDDVRNVEDLSKLPVLTKADVNEHFKELVSSKFDPNSLIPYQSGGSGEPLRFFITKESRSWELGAETRAYRWAGYRPGDSCFLLWGSNIDLVKHFSLLSEITGRLERVDVGDAWLLSDDVLRGFANRLIRKRPRIVKGYANAIFMFAEYCLNNGIDEIRPVSVITSAEKLLKERRKVIEDAFGCEVYDSYGSREVGAIAAECSQHMGYHVSSENVAVEILKDEESVTAGEAGGITLTNLRNYGMPFIRYSVGDVGVLSDDECSCGRGLPLISSLEGRFSDFLAVYDSEHGKIVPYMVGAPGFVGAVLMHAPVVSYRVIQESLTRMRVQIVKGDGFKPDHSSFIDEAINKFLGGNIKVEFEYLDSIPPLPSGKRSSFISKVNAFNNPQ